MLFFSNRNHQQNEKATCRKGIFANHVSGKGLISKIYKELIQPDSLTNAILKMGRGTEYFYKDLQMVDQY